MALCRRLLVTEDDAEITAIRNMLSVFRNIFCFLTAETFLKISDLASGWLMQHVIMSIRQVTQNNC